MAPKAMKAMKTAAMKTAMKAMKGKEAKAMKAMKATKVQLTTRKRRRDSKRNEGRDQSGKYSRKAEGKKLEVAKEELRVAEEEIGRLNREAEAPKTWRRMGGGKGVVDFRRTGEGEGEGAYSHNGWVAGYEAADEIDGGAEYGISDRKFEWVNGFMDGWNEKLAEKKREEEKEEEEKEKRKVKEEKGDSC